MPHTVQETRWKAIGEIEDTLRNAVDSEDYRVFSNLLLSATLSEAITLDDARDIHLRSIQRWDRLTKWRNRTW